MAISSQSGILIISVDSKKVENMLNGYIRNLPRLQDKVSKKIAQMYAAMYLTQYPRSRISPFTGHLFTRTQGQTTNPIKLGKGSYGVAVPKYAVWLDRMRPHWVPMRKSPMLEKWVKMKVQDTNKAKFFLRKRAVHVNPHPWIRSAHIRAGRQVRNIATFEVNNFLARKGK